MTNGSTLNHTWRSTFHSLLQPQVIIMLFLGFTAGLPLLLIFSTLSLWLREAGVERANVTFFSWAALAYSFKFVWSPLVDKLPIPLLTRILGRRRSWLLTAQLMIIAAIVIMASTNPIEPNGLLHMALAAVLLGFASATQDIVVDAYRIESAPSSMQAMLSSSYIAGYRVGMLVTGAGALYLASFLGTKVGDYKYSAWMFTYLTMAGAMFIGPITTLLVPEPEVTSNRANKPLRDYLGFVVTFLLAVLTFITTFQVIGSALAESECNSLAFLGEILRLLVSLAMAWIAVRLLIFIQLVQSETLEATYVAPIRDFFERYGTKTAWLLLALMGVYRISDIVLGVIA
ncbi:hypothetical protein TI04_10280, partial [Achromatium sp. WMS2]